jgi:negative regulator of sigma E activity
MKSTPHLLAREIVREWLVHHRLILDPMMATDLVCRIEAKLSGAEARLTTEPINQPGKLRHRSQAVLVGSAKLVAMAGLFAIAAMFSLALVNMLRLIIFT